MRLCSALAKTCQIFVELREIFGSGASHDVAIWGWNLCIHRCPSLASTIKKYLDVAFPGKIN